MPTFTLPDGTTREYDDEGPRNAASVLVLHDSDHHRNGMAPLRVALATDYRVIVPERPHPEAPELDATALVALLKYAHAAPAAVIGIGSGAATAFHMAKIDGASVYRIVADSVTLAGAPESLLGDILCHTIVVWGSGDEQIPRVETVRTALAIPRAQRMDYPCGHGVLSHLPDRFIADVQAWLHADAPPAKLPLNEDPPVRSFDA